MKSSKNLLQKISLVSGTISFILSIACMVWLFIRYQNQGLNDPISVSLMASIFFFICVGGVLVVITKANIPDFNIKTNPQDKD
ncbi:MAG: hypothetical protein OQK46_10340 [Gammaproteobacteria bacterium]|nr:hypothetical protein [Gammaproteobacteria bacterium]